MKRYTLHRGAAQDLEDLLAYLRSLPRAPALRLGKQIRSALDLVAGYPKIGAREETYCDLSGNEIRWFASGDYKIVYRADLPVPDVLGILHGKRDVDAIIFRRLR